MASPGSLSIIIDAGGLGALCQAEPQHQWTQQQPGHAARVRLHFLAVAWGFLPCPPAPSFRSPRREQTAPSGREITLQQSSHPLRPPRECLLILEPMGDPVCAQGAWVSCPGLSSLQDASQGTGPRMEKKVLGFSPIPTPTTPPPQHSPPHPAQETSVDQVATSCWLVTQLLFG